MKVAVVGLSPSSHDAAPWDDPEWELWGVAWDADRYRLHRAFEMHGMEHLRDEFPDLAGYLRGIEGCARLYMVEQYAEVPGCERYPFEDVARTVGDYWSSSIGYMLALAIHEGATEIAVYGVDMRAAEEYAYQRPNCEYLIGLARGRGIKVHIPDVSPLCKHENPPGCSFAGRYGKT